MYESENHMTQQTKLWKGEFGDDYTKRNEPSELALKQREMFWQSIYRTIYMNCAGVPKNVLEVGANQGLNLKAIQNVGVSAGFEVKVSGTEINDSARVALKEYVQGVKIVGAADLCKLENAVDMAFTYGVLIHTHPAHRLAIMRDMYNASSRWLMCAEYFAPETRAIKYRGEEDALWLDDYGSIWVDNFKLRVVASGFAWKKTTGLDNITWTVLEKVN